MKRYLLLLLIACSIFSCNTYKRAQKEIYSGNFDEALDGLIKKYANGNIKGKDIQRWADLFNEAYTKANTQNIEQIYHSQLLSEGSDKYRSIFNNYVILQSRYDKLKPYLPIRLNDATIPIRHENFYVQLESSRQKLADALYTEGNILLKKGNKFDAREAFEKFSEIAKILPTYPLIKDKMDIAYQNGLTHIIISVNNDSRSILPRHLHEDLTSLSMDNNQFFWQKFHSQPINFVADYYVELNFRDISISPELSDKKVSKVERVWIDSSEYKKDENGKIMKDKDGRSIRQYAHKSASARILEIFQKKSAIIQSEFIVLNADRQQISRISPINSRFDFDNIAYKIDGNEEAIDDHTIRRIKRSSFIPYPSDEEMVWNCGQDLKNQFVQFLARESSNK